ncbi:MAG TPA: AAA family ATPase [Candidatus Dojkabacteria bacterium]|nr:AAA family ATPase [Candidatus Dojkabacteria bacterium]
MQTAQTNPNTTTEEIEELNRLLSLVQSSQMPGDLGVRATAMVQRLKKVVKYGSFSREYEPVEKYISWITKVPWGMLTTDNLDLQNVKTQLDKTHYGLDVVKERLLEYIAMLNLLAKRGQPAALPVTHPAGQAMPASVSTSIRSEAAAFRTNLDVSAEMSRLQSSSSHAPIICFVGVQGIGKTSIAKSIAAALGRRFIRISLGGIGTVTELRGRSKGEVDSEPGQVIKALIRTGMMNPLILMDEVDKVSGETGLRADVMASLLEILDPEQNSTFIDHYLDYPVDLSKVLFICTANNLGGISAALLDRLEIIRMSSYTDEEKTHIARDYLLPKVMEASGVSKDQIVFHDEVWPLVIRPLGFDAGIRQLERNITTLVRKVAKRIVTGQGAKFEITQENFREFIPEDIGILA